MKKFLVCLISFLLIILSACHDDPEPVPVEQGPFTLNEGDSLALVAMMDCGFGLGSYSYQNDKVNFYYNSRVFVEPDSDARELRVVEIYSMSKSLSKGFPKEMGNLTRLKHVDVYVINSIDVKLFDNKEIFSCPLEFIRIMANEQKSPIERKVREHLPDEISNIMPNLDYLHIEATDIGGPLPKAIDLMKPGSILCLSWNLFTGKIPLSVRNCSYVYLQSNLFTEMDWRFYTEDVGCVPRMRMNYMTNDVPSEVLDTKRWEWYHGNYIPQLIDK